MDALFSNIQKSYQENNQQNNQNALLQNQQISQDKINELLNNASQALICGPTCQKLKVGEELKQKYLDAETNIKTAPINLEREKKNYYVFTEGRTFYDNMLEEELTKKVETISQLLGENFNDEVSSAKTMNQYLNTGLINSLYVKELLNNYIEKNSQVKLMLKNNYGDILTNDRKTYYETQELERLELWYKIWFRMFYVLVLVFNLCWLIFPSEYTWRVKSVLSLLLYFYPYYIDYVLRAIYKFFAGIYKNLPKNVYNNL